MTALHVVSLLAFFGVVACASFAGLCAHLCWLAVMDPVALWRIVAWVVGL